MSEKEAQGRFLHPSCELYRTAFSRERGSSAHSAAPQPRMLLLAFLPSESFTPSACAAHQSSRTAPRTAAVLASESDGPSPEEWREFRQKLVSGGLKLTTDVAEEAEAVQEDKFLILGSQKLKCLVKANLPT